MNDEMVEILGFTELRGHFKDWLAMLTTVIGINIEEHTLCDCTTYTESPAFLRDCLGYARTKYQLPCLSASWKLAIEPLIDGKWEFHRAVYPPASNDITTAVNLIRAEFENHYVHNYYIGDDDGLPEWNFISTLSREQERDIVGYLMNRAKQTDKDVTIMLDNLSDSDIQSAITWMDIGWKFCGGFESW